MAARLIGPVSSVYQAYGGPDVGGFGLVPPSSVPDVGVDEATRRRLLGDENTPPSWYVGTNPKALPLGDLPAVRSNGAKLLGPLATFNQQVATPPAGSQTPLAASTIAPKGGKPYQPNVLVDQAQEIYRRLKQQSEPVPASGLSTGENLAVSAANTYSNNMLATPSLLADVASYPVRRVLNYAKGKPTDVFGATPRVDVGDVAAGAKALTSDLTYGQARENIRKAEEARTAAAPISSALGEVGGDVATLALGRLPLAGGIRKVALAAEKRIAAAKTLPAAKVFETPADVVKAVESSPGWLKFRRGLGRTAEAGVEGATLGLLHDQDPVKAAGYTAGAQGTLSALTSVLTHKLINIPGGPAANFAVNLMLMSSLIYGVKVALPGQVKDYEAQKDAAQKVLIGTTLGAVTAAASTRDRTGRLSALAPKIMETVSSAPRNAMQSLLVQYAGSDTSARQVLENKFKLLQDNVERVTEPQMRDLNASLSRGKDAFLTQLDKITKGFTQ